MVILNKISSLHAEAIYDSFQKQKFGLNSCKTPADFNLLNRLQKVVQYYEVNKEQDRTMIVYFGETVYKYELEREIEKSYCPKINEIVNSL